MKMMPLSLYKCNSQKMSDVEVPRCWPTPTRKISLKSFKVVLLRRARALSYLCSLSAMSQTRPTADNLVPIHLDIDIDGQRFRDALIWNPSDPDSEVVVFAKRTVKDLKLPPVFITQIAQSIQTQLTEFRSYEGQDMYTGEKIVPIKLDLRVNHTLIKDHFLWDLNNFESDPEEFAKIFCKDMGIEDPEVGPAIAIAIREQLYEIAVQNVTSIRESRINKKGRRGFEHSQASKTSGNALDLFKLFGSKSSVIRKRKEWDVYEPVVDLLSNEEVDALEAKEERSTRS